MPFRETLIAYFGLKSSFLYRIFCTWISELECKSKLVFSSCSLCAIYNLLITFQFELVDWMSMHIICLLFHYCFRSLILSIFWQMNWLMIQFMLLSTTIFVLLYKVFTVQMRTWRSQLDQWNQLFMTICRFGTLLENASLDVLKANAENINSRWTQLSTALECRKVGLRL